MNDNKNLEALQKSIREAKERREKMENSGDDSIVGDPLDIPSWLKAKYREAGVHLSFINDLPGNIANCEQRGYFVVNEQGVDTKRHAGTTSSGQSYYTVLMGIPQDLYDKDRASEQKELDQITEDIRDGKVFDRTGKQIGTDGKLFTENAGKLIRRE